MKRPILNSLLEPQKVGALRQPPVGETPPVAPPRRPPDFGKKKSPKSLLQALQRGLEQLYRISLPVCVSDFVIDDQMRSALATVHNPREQLLFCQDTDDLELALFVDKKALDNLARNDPRDRLDESNFDDFLLTVEGVSHFVFLVWRALGRRPVSGLELELQAEVDKYVTCLLTLRDQRAVSTDLRGRLFEQFTLDPNLDTQERERYRVANSNARTYAASLHERFVMTNSLPSMLRELRRFYRLGAQEKLAHIALAA